MKNFKFKINGNLYDVDVLDIDGNMARIEVNGTLYEVEMQREIVREKPVAVAPQPKMATREARQAEVKTTGKTVEVKAPLPGVIIQVLVKPGDDVKAGQTLCTLETMKMENAIKADKDGSVTSVNITPGQSVLQDEVLLKLSE